MLFSKRIVQMSSEINTLESISNSTRRGISFICGFEGHVGGSVLLRSTSKVRMMGATKHCAAASQQFVATTMTLEADQQATTDISQRNTGWFARLQAVLPAMGSVVTFAIKSFRFIQFYLRNTAVTPQNKSRVLISNPFLFRICNNPNTCYPKYLIYDYPCYLKTLLSLIRCSKKKSNVEQSFKPELNTKLEWLQIFCTSFHVCDKATREQRRALDLFSWQSSFVF